MTPKRELLPTVVVQKMKKTSRDLLGPTQQMPKMSKSRSIEEKPYSNRLLLPFEFGN